MTDVRLTMRQRVLDLVRLQPAAADATVSLTTPREFTDRNIWPGATDGEVRPRNQGPGRVQLRDDFTTTFFIYVVADGDEDGTAAAALLDDLYGALFDAITTNPMLRINGTAPTGLISAAISGQADGPNVEPTDNAFHAYRTVPVRFLTVLR